MSRRILISENERSRILGLHENRRMKEWGLINEQMKYIKNTTTGKASMLPAGSIVPAGSVEIQKIEFDTLNNQLGTGATPAPAPAAVVPAPAAVVPAPAPFKPNGYESVEACKTAYNTTYLSGVSMKVFGQIWTIIQKKWLEAKCTGKTPCDKSGASNKNLAMAICEGTFNMDGPVVVKATEPPIDVANTRTPTSVSSTATQLGLSGTAGTTGTTGSTGTTQLQGVVDTTNMASRSDIRQQYRQGKRDVRELKKELNQNQNTLQRLGDKMTPEQKKQYETKIAQLQIQINQSAA